MLSPNEVAYLQGLATSPQWLSILKKLGTSIPPPLFKPGSPKDQYERWIYESGGHDAIKSMLSLLSGKLDVEG